MTPTPNLPHKPAPTKRAISVAEWKRTLRPSESYQTKWTMRFVDAELSRIKADQAKEWTRA